MTCSSSVNCTFEPPKIPANPDVGGVGVVVAAMVSAWVTFTFYLMIFFTFDHDDMNQLDQVVVHDIRRVGNYLLSLLRRKSTSISLPVVKQMALVLSDQQLITGTSVFVAAYADTCGITQYHFIVAYYLGCAGFLTHQSTLMISSDTMRTRVFMRAWRLVWVAVIFAFIPAANVIIVTQPFQPTSGKPVQCALNYTGATTLSTNRIPFLSLSCFCWAWGFYAVTRNLCPEGWDKLQRLLRPVFQKLRQHFRFMSIGRLYLWTLNGRLTAKAQYNVYFFWWPIHAVVFVVFLIFYTITELLCSNLTHLYRISIPLTSITYATYKLRSGAIGHDRHEQEEYIWSFGQVMPLGLLALPLFQVLEMLFDDWQRQRRMKKENKLQGSGERESFSTHLSDGHISSLGSSSTIQHETSVNTLMASKSTTRQDAKLYTTKQEHGDKSVPLGLRHVDTEMGKWDTNSEAPAGCSSSTEIRRELEEKMYGSRAFRMWMRLVIVAIFGASGYAISALTTD